jgi:hypothetical protein
LGRVGQNCFRNGCPLQRLRFEAAESLRRTWDSLRFRAHLGLKWFLVKWSLITLDGLWSMTKIRITGREFKQFVKLHIRRDIYDKTNYCSPWPNGQLPTHRVMCEHDRLRLSGHCRPLKVYHCRQSR